jgi:hypothetical protein
VEKMASVATDETVPDEVWWFSGFAEFEDFVGIGRERVGKLAVSLRGRVSPYIINRLRKANRLKHGPTNTTEGIITG